MTQEKIVTLRCKEGKHSLCACDGKNMATRDGGATVTDCQCECHEEQR